MDRQSAFRDAVGAVGFFANLLVGVPFWFGCEGASPGNPSARHPSFERHDDDAGALDASEDSGELGHERDSSARQLGAVDGSATNGGELTADANSAPGRDASGGAVEVPLNLDYVFADETLLDWVSYVEQVAAVTVVSEQEIPPPAEVLQRQEGYIGRKVSLRVNETLWLNRGVSPRSADFELVVVGWVLRAGERLVAVAERAPRLRIGGRYIMALTTIEDRISLLTERTVLAVPGDQISTEDIALHGQIEPARELSGLALHEIGLKLDTVPRDPVVERFRHLAPEERLRAVHEAGLAQNP